MQDACEELRADFSRDAITDVEVSSGGTWQRRRYSSLKWGGYCNFQKNGNILDIKPMSRTSKACVLKEPLKNMIP